MHTTIWLLTFLGAVPGGGSLEDPAWLNSYSQARKVAQSKGQPMVLFFGEGQDGWAKWTKDRMLNAEARQLLANQYVSVYVDTMRPEGRELAETFQVSGNQGLVISDRPGTSQAFHHNGSLTNEDLARYLKRYADPNFVCSGTESAGMMRTSYYAAPGATTAPAVNYNNFNYLQSGYAPSFGGFGGGRGCSSCR